MSELIPDPIDPMKGALDSEGRLLGAVFVAPVGTSIDEMRNVENLIGYSEGPTLGRKERPATHEE